MDLQAISDTGTIAGVCAIVFLLAARVLRRLLRAYPASPSFADSMTREAAERFRDQLSALTFKQSAYVGALLVFLLMYGTVSVFPAPRLFDGYPDWQLYILLSALVAAALFALYRLARNFVARRRVQFLHDANIAIAHQLQNIAAGYGRVFHDVPTTAGIVDHVVVGHDGVFAVNVVARRVTGDGAAALRGHTIVFGEPDREQSIVVLTASVTRLQKELSLRAGHPVTVRSVVAIPGWRVPEQTGVDHLLVNERTLPMITGWKDAADALLDEDIVVIQEYLDELCTRG